MDEKRWKGSLVELAVAKALLKKGYPVSFPFGEIQRYDLIVEIDSVLRKVECKNGRYKDGGVQFNCSGTKGPYTDDADFFGVYCIELDKTYLVPVDRVGINSCNLRIEATKNKQDYLYMQAEDYEI